MVSNQNQKNRTQIVKNYFKINNVKDVKDALNHNYSVAKEETSGYKSPLLIKKDNNVTITVGDKVYNVTL